MTADAHTEVKDAPPPAAVGAVLDGYPVATHGPLAWIRALILDTARRDARIGPLTETLKWGEPAYLTEASGSGSTIRLGVSPATGDAAMFLNCRTSLVATIRDLYGDRLDCVGDREVRLPADLDAAEAALRHSVTLALTYHLWRNDPAWP